MDGVQREPSVSATGGPSGEELILVFALSKGKRTASSASKHFTDWEYSSGSLIKS